jgi:hypothetical protein
MSRYKDDPLEFVSKSLHKSQIIPDVIPSSENFYPSLLFSVLYPANPERFVIGAELPRGDTLDEPDIVFTPMQFPDERSRKGEVTYTLVMTDPDAPSREDPKFAQFRHWVVRVVFLFVFVVFHVCRLRVWLHLDLKWQRRTTKPSKLNPRQRRITLLVLPAEQGYTATVGFSTSTSNYVS